MRLSRLSSLSPRPSLPPPPTQYNLKKQASEKSALESQTTSVNKRTKSSLNGMRAAIMTVEEVVKSRNQVSSAI